MFDEQYRELKTSLHKRVLDEVDLESLNRLDENLARDQVIQIVREMLQREKTPLALTERERLGIEILAGDNDEGLCHHSRNGGCE